MRSLCSKSCQADSTILIVSSWVKDDVVNNGTIHLAISTNDVLDLMSSKSTSGQ